MMSPSNPQPDMLSSTRRASVVGAAAGFGSVEGFVGALCAAAGSAGLVAAAGAAVAGAAATGLGASAGFGAAVGVGGGLAQAASRIALAPAVSQASMERRDARGLGATPIAPSQQ